MKTLTKAEATHLIATKVMGWEEKNHGSYTSTTGRIVDVLCFIKDDGKEMLHDYFNPFIDLNQAFDALEVWLNAGRRGYEMLSTTDAGHMVSLFVERGEYDPVANYIHKSAPYAICTALCSAVLGEVVEVSE